MSGKSTKVAPIPRGFRALTPHITTGDVNAAVALYQAALGADVVLTEVAPGTDEVIFAQLKIGNSLLTLGQGEAFGPGYVSLHHYVEDADATWVKALAAGFTELGPLEETYWGDRMGLLSDPLGVRWSIGQRILRLTAQERDARAKLAMGVSFEPEQEPVPLAQPASDDSRAAMSDASH